MKISTSRLVEIEKETENNKKEWLEIGIIECNDLHVKKRFSYVTDLWFCAKDNLIKNLQEIKYGKKKPKLKLKALMTNDKEESKHYHCYIISSWTIKNNMEIVALDPRNSVTEIIEQIEDDLD